MRAQILDECLDRGYRFGVGANEGGHRILNFSEGVFVQAGDCEGRERFAGAEDRVERAVRCAEDDGADSSGESLAEGEAEAGGEELVCIVLDQGAEATFREGLSRSGGEEFLRRGGGEERLGV